MMKRATLSALLLAAWTLTSGPMAAQAPEQADGADPTWPERHDFKALAFSAHPWSTVVAITLVLPHGSAADSRELPGSAWLLGQTLRDELERRLGPGTEVGVLVERGHTVFQVLAVPGQWRPAYEILVEGVFSAPSNHATLEARRSEVRSLFHFERAAPGREFQSELFDLLVGASSAWGGDPMGTPQSLERITTADLASLRRQIYRPEEAVVTVVGALDAKPGLRVYAGHGGDDGDTSSLGPAGGGGFAWSGGRRLTLSRDVTNVWIGAAFPAARDTPRTMLEFLGQRLVDDLNPTPRDPGLFGTEVRVHDLQDGPVLIIEAAVMPEDHARWEARIARTVAAMSERYADPALFTLHLRRFRNQTLVSEGAPEAEGRRIALDLLREDRVRDLEAEIGAINLDGIQRTIEAFGEPRVLVFGPDLGGRRER